MTKTTDRKTASETQDGLEVASMALGDVEATVPVHLDAFEGYMNARLGTSYATAFLQWFINHPDEGIALVARDDNEAVVGYVVGTWTTSENKLNRSLTSVGAFGVLKQPWLLADKAVIKKIYARMKLFLPGRKDLGPTPPALPVPTMILIGIGVSSRARGRHAGRALMKSFEKRSQQLGANAMLLSVYSDNIAAQRLYESQEWLKDKSNAFRGGAFYYSKTIR